MLQVDERSNCNIDVDDEGSSMKRTMIEIVVEKVCLENRTEYINARRVLERVDVTGDR